LLSNLDLNEGIIRCIALEGKEEVGDQAQTLRPSLREGEPQACNVV
jgi:hypothetical protein